MNAKKRNRTDFLLDGEGPLKQETYKQIKMAGIVMFIPIAVAIGPLSGFFLGEYLIKKFSLGTSVLYICITLGFLSGVWETVRIIRFMCKEGQK